MRGDRPWVQLYRFLERLPRHSHFHAALLEDEETAASLSERSEHTTGSFGMVGWTYERELLTTICDLLLQLHATFIQANSEDGHRPPVDPMPRPKTALDRVEARMAREAHRQRVRLLRPVE